MTEHMHKYSQDSCMLGVNEAMYSQDFSGLTSIQQHSCIVGVNRQNKMTHRKGATKGRKLPVFSWSL